MTINKDSLIKHGDEENQHFTSPQVSIEKQICGDLHWKTYSG